MSYETIDPSPGEEGRYTFKRFQPIQVERDLQAQRLRELRASNDPRAKLVQSAYVKAKREARAELQAMMNERLFDVSSSNS